MSNKENSLMKKTKKELVEIILRKDDVEAKLKEELESCKTKNAELRNKISTLEEQKASLTKSLETANRSVQNQRAGMDEYASQVAELKEKLENANKINKCAHRWNWIMSIALIILAIFCIVF